MTVTTAVNYKEYQANGIATVFAIPFLLLDRKDLKIYIDRTPVTAGYTVRGIGNPISEIIFEQAPTGRLLLQRSIALLRETDYQDNGDLLAKTVNQDFDRIYLAMQGLSQDFSKAIRVSDAEGIPELPMADERAEKLLSFDEKGQPLLVKVDSGSAVDLAKNIADTTSPSKGAGMVGYNQSLTYPNKTIGNKLADLTERFDHFEGNVLPMFFVSWWPSRQSIPAGFVVADGQELSAATYPDAANAIKTGKVPTVAEMEWQTNPVKRGSYVANSSTGKFRLPDYNGKYADSLGALFLRGDNGVVPNGEIQRDAMQNIIGSGFACGNNVNGVLRSTTTYTNYSGGIYLLNAGDFDASRVVRTAEENRPINVSGCWIIKLFGAVVNTGSANTEQLASDYANLVARFSVLESQLQAKKFTIIYPNGGTAENPANVTINNRYVMDNPFPNNHIICEAEILENGVWGNPQWFFSLGGVGTKASFIIETNKIIVQTGSKGIAYKYSAFSGDPFGQTIDTSVVSAPSRVKVWRVS